MVQTLKIVISYNSSLLYLTLLMLPLLFSFVWPGKVAKVVNFLEKFLLKSLPAPFWKRAFSQEF